MSLLQLPGVLRRRVRVLAGVVSKAGVSVSRRDKRFLRRLVLRACIPPFLYLGLVRALQAILVGSSIFAFHVLASGKEYGTPEEKLLYITTIIGVFAPILAIAAWRASNRCQGTSDLFFIAREQLRGSFASHRGVLTGLASVYERLVAWAAALMILGGMFAVLALTGYFGRLDLLRYLGLCQPLTIAASFLASFLLVAGAVILSLNAEITEYGNHFIEHTEFDDVELLPEQEQEPAPAGTAAVDESESNEEHQPLLALPKPSEGGA